MINTSSDWTKVLIHPLGLAGYVLFLLFGLLARAKRKDERRWILPASLVVAAVALFGGIALAFKDVDHKAHQAVASHPAAASSSVTTQQTQKNGRVSQTSSGAASPNIQGVQGDVNITIDQSKNKLPESRTPHADHTNPPK